MPFSLLYFQSIVSTYWFYRYSHLSRSCFNVHQTTQSCRALFFNVFLSSDLTICINLKTNHLFLTLTNVKAFPSHGGPFFSSAFVDSVCTGAFLLGFSLFVANNDDTLCYAGEFTLTTIGDISLNFDPNNPDFINIPIK